MIPPALALALVLPGAIVAVVALYAIARTVLALPRLVDDDSPAPDVWPRVSLIVAACNEEQRLEAAVRSRLAEDYPDLEVILVDDRSTDGTPALVDRLAAQDPRVRAVHIRELPAGWLGKLHAMHLGTQRATGAWLLFSDADVRFAPGTLRRAVARCERRGVDHLATMPDFVPQGLLIDTCIDAFCRALVIGGRLWQVADPRSRVGVGGGLFNLVRRSAFERTEGFAHLRLEVADDVALGQMLKRTGARAEVSNACGLVSLELYSSVREMAWGLEKNGFALVGFSIAGAVAFVLTSLWLELGWVVALASGVTAARALALIHVAAAASGAIALQRSLRRSLRTVPLMNVGMTLFIGMVARSAWLAWRRGAIVWRGTRYDLASLRAGRRLELL